MKTFDILNNLGDAEARLQYAGVVIDDILESYFADEASLFAGITNLDDFCANNHVLGKIAFEYGRINKFLCMTQILLNDMQDYITLAETGLKEQLAAEKKQA